MDFSSVALLEAILIASAISMDAFIACFAYGSNKIKIPILSVQVINIICGTILGISLLAGIFLKQYIPKEITIVISFLILFTLGVIKLLDSVAKSIIRKNIDLKKIFKFSMFHFKFILKLYADPVEADVDCSREISPTEAVSLAIALSLDGIAVGIGAAFINVNALLVFVCSLVINMLAIILGSLLGNKIAGKLPFNLSWLSGVLIITLALRKLF